MLREFKTNYKLTGGLLVPTDKELKIQQPCKVQLDFNIEEDCLIIPVYDNELDTEKEVNTKSETKDNEDLDL